MTLSGQGDLFACPDEICLHVEPVSPEDPDSSFDEILHHIRSSHPEMDQDPATLWPMIELKMG